VLGTPHLFSGKSPLLWVLVLFVSVPPPYAVFNRPSPFLIKPVTSFFPFTFYEWAVIFFFFLLYRSGAVFFLQPSMLRNLPPFFLSHGLRPLWGPCFPVPSHHLNSLPPRLITASDNNVLFPSHYTPSLLHAPEIFQTCCVSFDLDRSFFTNQTVTLIVRLPQSKSLPTILQPPPLLP